MTASTITLTQNAQPADGLVRGETIIVRRQAKQEKTAEVEKEERSNIQAAMKKRSWFQSKKVSLEELLGFQTPLIWSSIIGISIIHTIAALFLVPAFITAKWATVFWGVAVGGIAGFGVTAGAHRLWCHRSYSATLPLRILLVTAYSMAGQITLYNWVRDHRVHHKFSETDADPHNAKRGFFFAHVGWLMMKKHPEVLKHGKQIDMSDILADPVVQFHDKYFLPMKLVFCFILPSVVPALMWNELWWVSIASQSLIRYVMSLNFTWLVNSAAHMFGNRPYDARINPTENKFVSFFSMGEGWHNYHHTFPSDYKASELGAYALSLTTFWIDLFSKIGWSYDLKQPPKTLVKAISDKHGDGSHPKYGHSHSH